LIFINLAARLFKLWVVSHRSERGCSGFRIANTNEGYRSRVAKYLPVALHTLYRRRGSGTFESLTSDQTVVSQVEWHGKASAHPALFVKPLVAPHQNACWLFFMSGHSSRDQQV